MSIRLTWATSLSGWCAFALALVYVRNIEPCTPTVQSNTEYVDRIKTVTQLRTISKPDGTKIVTETRTDSQTIEKREASTKTAKAPLPKYSVAASVEPKLFDLRSPPTYRLEFSRRLWESPLWTTIEATSDRQISVGLRLEF